MSGRRVQRGRATQEQLYNVQRDHNIELITMMLEALEQEHEFLLALCFPAVSDTVQTRA